MNTTYRYLDTAVNLPDPLPSDLTLSMNQWLVKNNFTSIIEIFLGILYGAGFGDFDNLTAIDGLLQRTSTNLLYGSPEFPMAWFSVLNGCQSVYDGIYSYIGADSVRLNAQVDRVLRPRNPGPASPIIISGAQDGRPFIETCDNLVIAIPPTLENLAFMDLTHQEYDLFQGAATRYFFTGIHTAQMGTAGVSSNFTLANFNLTDPLGRVAFPDVLVAYRKFSAGPVVQQSFSSDPISQPDMLALVESKLSGLVAAGVYANVSDVRTWIHPYDPHWPRPVLAGPIAPQNRFDDIQGTRKTHYFGPVRITPSTAPIINYVHHELEIYF